MPRNSDIFRRRFEHKEQGRMPSVFIKTLGCKVNTFDSHALASQFARSGCTVTDSPQSADISVVNTCSVTANAEKEARYCARRLKRENPKTFVVLTGCYAQTDSAGLAQLVDVDFIVPNQVKTQASALITAAFHGQSNQKLPQHIKPIANNRQSHFKSALTLFDNVNSNRTRAFVKIQDGCNGFCTYCLIPYARGASVSVPADPILAEVQRLESKGVPEVVLTGIHIGDWGRDLATFTENSHPIVDLLETLLAATESIVFRISSLEPSEVQEDLIAIMAAHPQRFCNHFHLPLQSGSDPVLRRMGRTYSTAGYRQAVGLIRASFPDANIGADTIPGFPGETKEDHERTKDFVGELGLSYLHVFPYSQRPNTAAARMGDHIDRSLIKERAQELRKISHKLANIYASRFVGANRRVIWEEALDEQGRRKGHTDNYLAVVASQYLSVDAGQISHAQLKGLVGNSVLLAGI